MTPKLQKLSAMTKLTALLALFFTGLYGTSQAQVFPSQIRISVGAEYGIYPLPENNPGVSISPSAFLGAVMEFKQLYALQLILHGNNVKIEHGFDAPENHPTLGFSHDLILKLYRSDPSAFFTPVGIFGVSKQWSLVRTPGETANQILDDISDWQIKAFAGADLEIAQNLHVKPVAGVSVSLEKTEYFEGRVFPVFRISTDFWF